MRHDGVMLGEPLGVSLSAEECNEHELDIVVLIGQLLSVAGLRPIDDVRPERQGVLPDPLLGAQL